MALLLRRGLEADRLSFTPEEGELIYVTDTKQIYVGDGVTPGGNLLTGGGETPVATYQLSRSVSQVTEGGAFTITLTTTNVANGTNVPYTITGVSSADIDGDSLTGNFVINSNSDSIIFNVTDDGLIESVEQFTLTLDSIIPTKTISVAISDIVIGDIDGGSPTTPSFTTIIDGGSPSTNSFDTVIDGGTV